MGGRTAPPATPIVERITDATGSSTAFTKFGAVATKRNRLIALILINTSNTPGYLDIRDGVGGAILTSFPLPNNSGGVVYLDGIEIATSSLNTALAFDVSAALSTIIITAFGKQE